MKKILSLILLLSLLFALGSCVTPIVSDGSSSESSKNNSTTSTSCNHKWKAATCTTAKTCSLCQETSGKALGHTTDTGKCSRCGENFSSWELGEFTDEFNQPTGKKYIGSECVGTFSNSATTNSKLTAYIQIDSTQIGIMLWEYGSMLVKGIYSSGEDFNITILDENGTKYYYSTTLYKNSSRIYFNSSDRTEIINLIRNNDSLQIYIKSAKFTSSYLFTLDTTGFASFYSQLN